MTRPIEIVLARLPGYRREPGGFVARCPAHSDKRPSLRVGEAPDGRVLMKCRAGCPTGVVLQRIGLAFKDLFVAGVHKPDCRCNVCRPYRAKPGDEPLPDEPEANVIWEERAAIYKTQLKLKALRWLADKLGVTPSSLADLGIGMVKAEQLMELRNARTQPAYTFPERDSKGACVGISLRWPDGEKGFVTGGHRGLTIPRGLQELPGLAICVEGASDTAALLTLGYCVIGRPSNTGGFGSLARILRSRDVLMLGEYDEKAGEWPSKPADFDKLHYTERLQIYRDTAAERARQDKPGGWPGGLGAWGLAEKLAVHWKRPVYWALPPVGHKDIRAWLNSTGGAGHVNGQTFLQVINFEVAGGNERKRRLESLRRQARKESK